MDENRGENVSKMWKVLTFLWKSDIMNPVATTCRCGNIEKRLAPCTKTRLWSARIADRNSPSLQVNRNFMLKKASPTSPSVVRRAVRLAKPLAEKAPNVRCMMLFVLPAARLARFPSSPMTIVRSTAAIASVTASNLVFQKGNRKAICLPVSWFFLRKVRFA